MKTILLPSGMTIGVAAYVKAWKQLKTLRPDYQVLNWDHFSASARSILEEMRRGIDVRINRHLPLISARGENDFWEMRRLANRMNGTRVIIRNNEVPARWRARLASRITTEE